MFYVLKLPKIYKTLKIVLGIEFKTITKANLKNFAQFALK